MACRVAGVSVDVFSGVSLSLSLTSSLACLSLLWRVSPGAAPAPAPNTAPAPAPAFGCFWRRCRTTGPIATPAPAPTAAPTAAADVAG